jgi:hypothetical protein
LLKAFFREWFLGRDTKIMKAKRVGSGPGKNDAKAV